MLYISKFKLKQAIGKLLLIYTVITMMAVLALRQETRPAHAAGGIYNCTNYELLSAMLTGGYIQFNCDGEIDFGETTFTITKEVVLDGSNHNVTLKGRQLFKITPTGKLSLNTLTLSGGGGSLINPVFKGGMIYNSGGLGTVSVNFKNNHAYTDGGAIYNDGGLVYLSLDTFSNNKANGRGGAVYNNGGQINDLDTVYEQNQAGFDGGAIASVGGELDLNGTQFRNNKVLDGPFLGPISEKVSNNQASYNGGAVYSTGKLTAKLNRFENNSVTAGVGGAIYAAGSTKISQGFFLENFTSLHGKGGAVYNLSNDFMLNDTKFQSNKAFSGAALFNAGKALVSKNSFYKNEAENGAAIYNAGNGATVLNSTFANNTANSQGGGVYTAQGGMTLINSTFSANSASKDGKAGASIYRATQDGSSGVLLFNTILNSPVKGQNCGGYTVLDNGRNIQYPSNSCGQSILTTDPLLDQLDGHGLNYLFFPLKPGSPAINFGNYFVCTATPMDGLDGRGMNRTIDGKCDSGAYEYYTFEQNWP